VLLPFPVTKESTNRDVRGGLRGLEKAQASRSGESSGFGVWRKLRLRGLEKAQASGSGESSGFGIVDIKTLKYGMEGGIEAMLRIRSGVYTHEWCSLPGRSKHDM